MISVVIGQRRIRLSGNRFSPALQVFFLSETCLKGSSLREKEKTTEVSETSARV